MSFSGWVGVDLDCTLAHYNHGDWAKPIGEPIPEMVERVKQWRKEGVDVRIFTARVGPHDDPRYPNYAEIARKEIEEWCIKHIGEALPVTCIKDYAMIELWDDRAVQVEPNTGRRVGNYQRSTK